MDARPCQNTRMRSSALAWIVCVILFILFGGAACAANPPSLPPSATRTSGG